MNIIPNHLMASRLQNIIDSNPFAHSAKEARDLMDRLKPMPGHEPDPYSAGSNEAEQEVGDVSELANSSAV